MSAAAVEVRFAGEGQGEVVAFDGSVLALVSSSAFAPGTPLAFTVRSGDEGLELSGKTKSCKRRADGRFDLGLRLVDLRRAQREALQRMLGQ
jgi:hypothetical protein